MSRSEHGASTLARVEAADRCGASTTYRSTTRLGDACQTSFVERRDDDALLGSHLRSRLDSAYDSATARQTPVK